MAEIIIIRAIIDSPDIGRTSDKILEELEQHPSLVDVTYETVPLPDFIADSIVNKTYAEGDFCREIVIGFQEALNGDGMKYVLDGESTKDINEAQRFQAWDLPELEDGEVAMYLE